MGRQKNGLSTVHTSKMVDVMYQNKLGKKTTVISDYTKSMLGADTVEKAESIDFCWGKVLAIKWADKKDVTMLSIVHTSNMVDVMYHNKLGRKTTVISDYTKSMPGVDIVEPYLCDYSLARKKGKILLI